MHFCQDCVKSYIVIMVVKRKSGNDAERKMTDEKAKKLSDRRKSRKLVKFVDEQKWLFLYLP